jgi:hypothetical protein
MKNIIDRIVNINYQFTPSEYIYIKCINNNIIAPIVIGSVEINIIDTDNNIIGINNININDIIKIYYREKINDYIKPIKIIKMNNYIFNDDSNSSEDILF